MAAVALNKFRTIRYVVNTFPVGIYTCPIGVASIVILSQVTNVSNGVSSITAIHSRSIESQADFKLANNVPVPPQDSYSIVSDGRLALETNDVIKIQGTDDGALELILSVLETAKQ
jgi:hypothetical protein